MKKITPKFKEKRKIPKIIYLFLLSIIVTFMVTYWFTANYRLQSPLIVKFQPVIVKREMLSPVSEKVKEVIEYDDIKTVDSANGNKKCEKGKQECIKDKIKTAFGKDYDKAILLLQGRDSASCAENRGLDPQAINTNKDGSRDLGVFQISSKWHRIPAKFLLNEDINIAVAKQLYEESDNTFSAWTCGKAYKI